MTEKDEKSAAIEFVESLEKRDGKFILPLEIGVNWGDEGLVKELELVRPLAKHIRSMPLRPTMDDLLKVSGSLCSRPDRFIDELTTKDTTNLSLFFGAFN